MEAKLSHTKQSQAKQGQGNTSKTDNSLNSDLKASLLKLLGSINKETSRINSQANTIKPGSPLTATTPTSVPTTILKPPLPGSQPQAQKRQTPNITNTQNMLTILLELGKQVEGAIARTQLHQTTSLPAGGEQAPILLAFELPIRNDEKIDIFHLFIEEDTESSDNEEEQKKRWSITIALDLENLGPMYVRLNLANDKISTTFWTENPKTSEIINQHLDSLNQRYKQSGLEPKSTQCFQGMPITSEGSNNTHVVLDVNA
jgi:flagellar hook-length control protein FliK